jgi:hypothetical protein
LLNIENISKDLFNEHNLMGIKPLKCIFAELHYNLLRMNKPVAGFSKLSRRKK